MNDGIDPIEFGKLLAMVQNVQDDVTEIKADVKTQNSRTYKVEERLHKVEDQVKNLPPEVSPKTSMKDKVVHYGVPGAAGGTAIAIIYGLVELLKGVLLK